MRQIRNLARARIGCALVAASMLAASTASAASLTVNSAALAAEQLPVVSCDTSVTVSWTTLLDLDLGLIVDDVTLSGISGACDGRTFKVTLALAGTNVALGSGTYVDPVGAGGQINPGGGANQSVTFDFSGQAVLSLLVGHEAWSIAP